MIQLTHLGRRTRWDKADWLPVVSPSHEREAAHRSFPKKAEDWDIARIIEDYADAAERMQAAGLDGIELEAYGHLIDQFWSPLTNDLDAPWGGSLDDRLRFTFDVAARDPRPGRRRLHRRHPLHRRRGPAGRAHQGRRHRDLAAAEGQRPRRLPQRGEGPSSTPTRASPT